MFGECLGFLNEGNDDKLIRTLELEKSKDQDLFNKLITQNDYEIFNRALHLGSKSVTNYILLAYTNHQALISSKEFKIFSDLIADKRYDMLNVLFRHINSDCIDMLFDKFGEFQMSLWCIQTGIIQFYRERQSFSYSQFSEIIKAAIKENSNTKWLYLNFRRHNHQWADTDLLDCLKIAIRVGNLDIVKLIEAVKFNIFPELLQPEHSYAFVEASRHVNLFYYLLKQLSHDSEKLKFVFSANEYAWLHAVVEASNNSHILSGVLSFFDNPPSKSLAISSRDHALYDFAYLKENTDMMEVLLADETVFEYAMKYFKYPKYDEILIKTPHLKRLMVECEICLGHGQISKTDLKNLLQPLSLDKKREYLKLAIQQKHITVIELLYLSIQYDASQILCSEIKKEIAACRSLSLTSFLMQWNQKTVLEMLEKDLHTFFNFSISKNWTHLLVFLHQHFRIQFQEFFKDLTYWQKIVANFSVDVFEWLFTIMNIEDIEQILKQDNYRLFYAILEKSLAEKHLYNHLSMLNKVMSKFPLLRLEMVTSNQCVSLAIQARDAVTVRTLLSQDKTIFFAVIQQLFELDKKNEIFLLLGLVHAESYCRKPVHLNLDYHDVYKRMLDMFPRKRRMGEDLTPKPKCARP